MYVYHDTAFDLSRNWMFKVINGIWSVEHLYILISSDLWYSYHSSIYRANKNYEKSKMSSRTCITILYSDKHNITPPPSKKKNLGKLLPPACNPLWQSTHYIVLATPFIWPSCLEILDMIFWAINYFLGTD